MNIGECLVTSDTVEAVPITAVDHRDFEDWLERQSPPLRRWIESTGFRAASGETCLLRGETGALSGVLVGIDQADEPWDWAALPTALPPGRYRIESALSSTAADAAALGWGLGSYRFQRYRKHEESLAVLNWPERCDREATERALSATFLARDLINTPAADMGPEELSEATADLAEKYGGQCTTLIGGELIAGNYPAIHAVGRASARPPRLVDLRWGEHAAPKLSLVGKGVCFDSGGLNIKTGAGMRLMKKDMGGAAIMLGLAEMIMSARLPVRLRVLIPAVENSISGDANRPGDVIQTRKGLTVEIGNTDAEGRLILADALTEAASESPALLIDCATLTGAARVALGTELPALFTGDDTLATSLLAHGLATADPLWRLPLWTPYRRHLNSKVADINNVSSNAYAGAIYAALFLAEFVDDASPWAHLDVMAWNTESRPGRPEGGEAMGMRALFAMISERFSTTP